MTDDPLTIDPDKAFERLAAKAGQQMAQLLAENARLETALAAALERLRGVDSQAVNDPAAERQ